MVKLAESLGCLPGDLLDGYRPDACAPAPTRHHSRALTGSARPGPPPRLRRPRGQPSRAAGRHSAPIARRNPA